MNFHVSTKRDGPGLFFYYVSTFVSPFPSTLALSFVGSFVGKCNTLYDGPHIGNTVNYKIIIKVIIFF
jgi:hypothetical protein